MLQTRLLVLLGMLELSIELNMPVLHCRVINFRRKDVSEKNRFVWFKWWILGKQTIDQISAMSGHSVRQLKRWFYRYLENAPTWSIKRRESVNLLIH